MSLLYSLCTLRYNQTGERYMKLSVGRNTSTLGQANEVTPVQHR